MPTLPYSAAAPTRAEIDARPGPLVLDFGTDWCGFCRAAAPHIERALADRADLAHLKIEDGKGRALGRSFGVKLWPTVIVMRAGREVGRVVRPQHPDDVAEALAGLDDADPT